MAAWVGHGAALARARPGLLAKRLGPCLGNGSGVAGSAVTPHGVDHAISNVSRQQRAVIRCRPGSAMGRRRTLHRNRTGQSAAIGWLRRPSSRIPGADRSDGRLSQHGGNRPFLLAVSSASGFRSSEASSNRRPPAWGSKAASPSHQGAAGAPANDRDAFKDADRIEGDMGATTGSSWKTAGTVSMGDPYATPRRQNVVTPWSKKHPDGGSATAQRTDFRGREQRGPADPSQTI
jgi:hypothetical protein